MSLGGRKAKLHRGVKRAANVVHHASPGCPLRPENLLLHTVLDRRRLSCTCWWDKR